MQDMMCDSSMQEVHCMQIAEQWSVVEGIVKAHVAVDLGVLVFVQLGEHF